MVLKMRGLSCHRILRRKGNNKTCITLTITSFVHARSYVCVLEIDRDRETGGIGRAEEEEEGERERERDRRAHAGGMQWLHVTTTQAAPAAAAAPLRDVG